MSFLADFLSKAGQTISASSHARSQCTRAHFTTSRQTIIESPPRPPGNRSVPRPPTWPASLLSSYSLPIIIIIQQPTNKDARQKRGARAAFRAELIMPALGDPLKIKMPGHWRVFYKGFNHASASVSRVKMPGDHTQARSSPEEKEDFPAPRKNLGIFLFGFSFGKNVGDAPHHLLVNSACATP